MQSFHKTLMTFGALATIGQARESLPELQAIRDEITVSGNSAGGHWSCHLMWTNASLFKGAGCSKSGGFDMDLRDFKNLTEEMIAGSIAELKQLDQQGVIDPLENLKDGKHAVYIISGLDDRTVPPENQQVQKRTFLELGM